MGLRDFFRRHGNVFSISGQEVDGVKPGEEDMLVEEYGKRAVEARRLAPRPGSAPRTGGRGVGPVVAPPQLDVSEDELADEDPPPDSADR